MTKIHPALAEHALLKNSELHQRIAELEAQVAALSQQAEPGEVVPEGKLVARECER